MNAAFRPAEHIRRRADFEQAYKTGARANGRFMTLFARATGESVPRLGIAATRKIGGAVVRNRAKRLVRELFRHQKPASGLDIVVVPRREFLDASFDSLEREFATLLERVRRARAHSRV
jgi:ribonuclease P protein component